jgi:hypothetical protein
MGRLVSAAGSARSGQFRTLPATGPQQYGSDTPTTSRVADLE